MEAGRGQLPIKRGSCLAPVVAPTFSPCQSRWGPILLIAGEEPGLEVAKAASVVATTTFGT
ncbi:MAG TPA: hypothetical protein PK440_17600, partial [Candidatus Accumulibacter phosphatis]|nr:hypothetical protein [Candidatus Accumulibacter phosphatis]